MLAVCPASVCIAAAAILKKQQQRRWHRYGSCAPVRAAPHRTPHHRQRLRFAAAACFIRRLVGMLSWCRVSQVLQDAPRPSTFSGALQTSYCVST